MWCVLHGEILFFSFFLVFNNESMILRKKKKIETAFP